ncbi:hypothetical protein DFQ28_000372 [Apophysomyces sp. BC1034]|nr:hypothetical protein DFQ29_005175 [Apophysomyces sp. BC1021]KAG0191359.1 hypothetical protein DFQ28_000372 [Apophysomyces sp. BC1034]
MSSTCHSQSNPTIVKAIQQKPAKAISDSFLLRETHDLEISDPARWTHGANMVHNPSSHDIAGNKEKYILTSQGMSEDNDNTFLDSIFQTSPQLPSTTRPVGVDLGNLDSEEQAALKAEITARRAIRRATRRKNSKAVTESEEEEDHHVIIGTRVTEGHRNYVLM